MVQFKIPPSAQVADGQFISVEGPDGLVSGFAFDKETNSFYAKESQIIIPPFHGFTHISEDPVPLVTTDLPGLMSASDKAKLDAVTQTRLGILGFQGSGFPDDGGFMQGDIILSAGSEFIQLERIGNVVRFTVDAPIPLNCGCEECAQIFWIQDESDKTSIRPPSCAGKLPGVNAYGELKVYLLPQSTIVNKDNPTPTLNLKSNYPALIFRRFLNAPTPGQAEFELILARNNNGTSRVGWAMTPGSTGVPIMAWFMGQDNDGNQVRFDLNISPDSGLLGSILYKGHTLTRQMAVITNYTPTILTTNQYLCRFWNVAGAQTVGQEFTATNAWRYQNPGNSPTALVNPQQVVLDATTDLLPVGTLVQIWEFKIGEINGQRLVQRFFNLKPSINPGTLWGLGGVIRFGDLLTSRAELEQVSRPTELTSHDVGVSDIRLIERTIWGITGFEDKLLLADDGHKQSAGTILTTDTVATVVTHNPYNPTLSTDTDDPRPNFVVTGKAAQPTGAWSLNQFAGQSIKFTSGVLSGQTFTIIENTVSTLTAFDPDGLGVQILVGDKFDVVVMSPPSGEPSGNTINNQYVAEIDPARPGLKVLETPPPSDVERPVYLWHRGNHKNVYVKALIGRPQSGRFPPIDLLLQAPIDNLDDRYAKVIRRGTFTTAPFAGMEYIAVKGLHWSEIPPTGDLRILTGYFRNEVWKYYYKAAFDSEDDDAVVLIGSMIRFPFDSDVISDREGSGLNGELNSGTEAQALLATKPDRTTAVQVLHQDYSTSALRIEFSINDNASAESLQLQLKGGILDISTPYELNLAGTVTEDFVRGLRPGSFAVSKVYTQQGFISTGLENPAVSPDGFKVYDGGFIPQPISNSSELWNVLEVMYRDGQLWVWWNNLLIPPDTTASAALPTPVAVNTPYFPVPPVTAVGKVGLRLWPGAVVREFEIRDQLIQFNEFNHGQLQLAAQ